MTIFRSAKFIVCILSVLFLSLSGCKKVGKEIAEKFAKEAGEESVELVAKKSGKASLKELGEKAVRNLKYDDFIAILKKNNPLGHASFTKLDNGFQKKIVQSINENPKVYDAIVSSKTIIDEFAVATSKTPLLAKNANFFSHFVTHPQFASDLMFKESDNLVEFISKADGKRLAKYKDGILDITEPFAKDGHTFGNSLLKEDFIPNTLYKVKGNVGSSYLIKTDGIGNIVTADIKKIKPEDLTTNILNRRGDIDLGTSWKSSYSKIKQASKQGDVDVSLRFSYFEGNPNPRSVKISAKRGDKTIIDERFENKGYLENSLAKSSSNFYKETGEPLTESILRKIAGQHEGLDKVLKNICYKNSFNLEDFIIKKGPRGGDLIIHKSNPRISMEIKGNTIFAKSGSHALTNGINDMLNYALPNKTYIVDDCFQYKTNKYGNVIEAIADRNKAKSLPARNTPHSPTQKMVSEKGVEGDQSGHLFARSTNGPNEAINQVPMEQNLNEHGKWRELERIEEKALNEGKKVISKRRLIYDNPKSGRPSKIIFEYEIDGVKTTVTVTNPVPQKMAA